MNQQDLIERLKEFRATLKCSQKELAERLNISPTTYNAWETARSQPGAAAIFKLTTLGLNAHWLLTGDGPMIVGGEEQKGTALLAMQRFEEMATAVPFEPPPMAIDYSLKEAAEQLREAGLLPALLMGRRGRFNLRWRLLRVLMDAKGPISLETVYTQLAAIEEHPTEIRELLGELQIGVDTGLLKQSPEGYAINGNVKLSTNQIEDFYSAVRAVINGLGHDVVPAMKRQDGTGGISIWTAVVDDGKTFLRAVHRSTKSLLKQHASETGDVISLYIAGSTSEHGADQ